MTRREFLLTASVLPLAGCKTTNGEQWLTPERVEALTAVIVYAGASATITAKPDTLDEFVTARDTATKLVALERWDLLALAACLRSLPIDEFNTKWGKLAWDAGLPLAILLFDALGLGKFDAKNDEHVKAVVLGVTHGLQEAVNWADAPPNARGMTRERLMAAERATR